MKFIKDLFRGLALRIFIRKIKNNKEEIINDAIDEIVEETDVINFINGRIDVPEMTEEEEEIFFENIIRVLKLYTLHYSDIVVTKIVEKIENRMDR